MISDKEQPEQTIESVQQTIECIGMMWRALTAISERELPDRPQWFAIMAEEPVDQIRELLDEVDAYIGKVLEPIAREAAALEARKLEEQAQEEQEREEIAA